MNLLEQILSNQNMNEAYLRVYRNKGASGVDGITVEELKEYLKENKDELRQRIRARKYQPQAALRVEIPKENGKMRKLGIPTVVDRVVQQAIHQVLSPIFEKQFSEFSYGFRPKRSCEMAIVKSLEFLNDGYDWVVDIDLERFFDTVHHDKLMRIIANTIDDGDVISLIRKYLVSGVMVKGKYEETPVGTPQGGNLSPLLSNIMLNELDKEFESRGLRFIRYADDALIFVCEKRESGKSRDTFHREANRRKTGINRQRREEQNLSLERLEILRIRLLLRFQKQKIPSETPSDFRSEIPKEASASDEAKLECSIGLPNREIKTSYCGLGQLL
ncbi:group II intron reverse transcriptase/maturase [Enterococcus dispar]|uniref:Reverse transcriptase domain-containing protein n=1 Tax=Enterococcus dispar ATCC 51266 TaxID=1139219 RepID=S0K8Q3_9ENTE|nr:group II intron reverse transcriptase/maturase [Enterococcus dispar]EOT41284.1 hypothetical protein OMK_01455 [Enterococcus dispar ATCC 51266]EOW87082.1 hypothetical protein I569_02451 [Enterococcus dispar ATCC 51266]OJG37586.1 hypothetical protein RV01_GL001294 [Enterococcus dispar]